MIEKTKWVFVDEEARGKYYREVGKDKTVVQELLYIYDADNSFVGEVVLGLCLEVGHDDAYAIVEEQWEYFKQVPLGSVPLEGVPLENNITTHPLSQTIDNNVDELTNLVTKDTLAEKIIEFAKRNGRFDIAEELNQYRNGVQEEVMNVLEERDGGNIL